MKRYTASQARQHLSDLLDAAERGQAVVIERRSVQFRLEPLPAARGRSRRSPVIEVTDPAVAEGTWTWSWGPRGIRFSARRRRQ